MRHAGLDKVVSGDKLLPWKRETSKVNGELPITDKVLKRYHAVEGTNWFFARFDTEVLKAGELALNIPNAEGIALWAGKKRIEAKDLTKFAVEKGPLQITIGVDEKVRGWKPLAVVFADDQSSAQVEMRSK